MFNVSAYKTYNRETSTQWIPFRRLRFDRTHTRYVQTCSKFLVNIQVKLQSQQKLQPYKSLFCTFSFQKTPDTHNSCAVRYAHEAWKCRVTCPHPLVLLWDWGLEHLLIQFSWAPRAGVETLGRELVKGHTEQRRSTLPLPLLKTLPSNFLPLHV